MKDTKTRELILSSRVLVKDYRFEVGTHRSKTSQIDVVVRHQTDRVVRVIECKLCEESKNHIEELLEKDFPLSPRESRMTIRVEPGRANNCLVMEIPPINPRSAEEPVFLVLSHLQIADPVPTLRRVAIFNHTDAAVICFTNDQMSIRTYSQVVNLVETKVR